MNTLGLLALLLTLSAVFCILNDRWLRLPMTIGVMLLSIAASLLIIATGLLCPAYDPRLFAHAVLGTINLPEALLNGALSLLLFAGALGVDLGCFRSKLKSVTALAVLGTILAVLLLAGAAWLIFPLLGVAAPFSWCVVLGAILAPTDPVSVIGMLRRLGLPQDIQAIFAGESLFNDGISIVIFGVTIGLAVGDASHVTSAQIAEGFLWEAFGGGLLGLATGWLTLFLLRASRDAHTQLIASLALATGTYSVATCFGMSGAVAVVTAGLCLSTRYSQSIFGEHSRKELNIAWSLIDEVLNVLLFLLIGFQILEVPLHLSSLAAMLVIVPLSICGRGLSVFLSTLPLHIRNWDKGRLLGILTWGGLRGGISLSLALGLPEGELRNLILPVCYGVVVFTIIVQGLTMERVVRRFYPAK
ncbi:cation:proton antiporter [Acetobacter sp.]|jgi:CPA1 family monovalent cation:H+ antiporter|uniref:cation:proton antiporter n=1 Tax=Acetobacter sp. TaxID=440 RepID=UPI0025C4B5DA|nr:sodium:proton antiporter [Acetobacter sp.]MCH4092130.1 sodium:proton antiporter [Acetobacter sp.]MCI1299953.1 sodium:proton antiporter [Acetobacter sp.]MCI1315971.1 sodium:proton antiporter [Acetobacter sp.]